MDKRNLKRLFTMQSIIGFATSATWTSVTSLVAAFSNGITALTSVVNQITGIAGAQSASVAGGAAVKNYYRGILQNMSFAIMNAAKGYALSIPDQDLAEQLSITVSDMDDISDKNIANSASNWLTIVNGLITNLGPWGITTTTITNWQTAIDNYNGVYLVPKDKKELKKELTRQERQLIKQGMAIVKSTLDTAVSSFIALNHQDYVDAYKGYRRIGQANGIRHTRLNALVVNELGEPFFDVKVTVEQYTNQNTGKTYKAVSANTDINGYCHPEKFQEGPRYVKVSGDTIVETTFGPFEFEPGKILNQVFTVQPAFNNLPAPSVKTEKEKVNK